MSTKFYTEEHEWIEVVEGIATVGISDFAQQSLGDIVFVELPEVDRDLSRGDGAAVVESVKAASDIYAPIDGRVTAINEALEDNPALINEDAEAEAWFFRTTVADTGQLDDLMDETAYKAFVGTLE